MRHMTYQDAGVSLHDALDSDPAAASMGSLASLGRLATVWRRPCRIVACYLYRFPTEFLKVNYKG